MSYIKLTYEETPRYEGAPATAPYRISTIDKYLPIQSARIAPGPQHIDRSDELRNIEGSVSRLLNNFEPDGNITYRMYPNTLSWILLAAGWQGVRTAGGASGKGGEEAVVTGVNALNSPAVNVVSTAGFAPTGSIVLPTGAAFAYTGLTATSFTGCAAHGATVGGEIINDLLPTGASKWEFTKRGGLTAKTLQMILAFTGFGSDVFVRGQGFGITNLTLNAEGAVSADMQGLTFQRISDPVDTVVLESASIPPFRRADLQLFWLTGSGESDDFSIAIANPLNRRMSFSSTVRSYFADKMFNADERVTITGSIPKYSIDSDDIDALMNANTFAASARWTSDATIPGAGTTTYKLYIKMPSCQLIGGGPDELGNRRRFGANYDFWAAWDETAGYDAKIISINNLAANGIENYV